MTVRGRAGQDVRRQQNRHQIELLGSLGMSPAGLAHSGVQSKLQ